MRAYEAQNAERIRARRRADRARIREREKLRAREYRAADPERFRKAQARHRAKRPDLVRAAQERYRLTDRGNLKAREKLRRRRALRLATQVEPVDYAELLAECGMFCHICSMVIVDRSDLHMDHVIPLALGGTHTRDNIKPAHALCNLRKGARTA
jgi:5-methylcytosine-specific restriction endonuclease McrA